VEEKEIDKEISEWEEAWSPSTKGSNIPSITATTTTVTQETATAKEKNKNTDKQ